MLLLEQVELFSDHSKLVLELRNLVLQNGDDTQASVHGIFFSGVSFICDRFHGILTFARVDVLEDAEYVGDAKKLVHVLKSFGLVGWEVG